MSSNHRTLHRDLIFAFLVEEKTASPLTDITFVILAFDSRIFLFQDKSPSPSFLKSKNANLLSAFLVQSQNHLSSLPSPPPTNTRHINCPRTHGESHGWVPSFLSKPFPSQQRRTARLHAFTCKGLSGKPGDTSVVLELTNSASP